MQVKIFVDTNILLHFKPLDEINLAKLVGEKKIDAVLFAPIIISEIDKHKRNSNSKISLRARNASKTILERSSVANPNNALKFEVLSKRPIERTFTENDLEKNEQDDNLLASILEYKSFYSDVRVILLTDDTNCMLKCKIHSIETLQLDDEYILVDNEDNIVKEFKKLQEKHNALVKTIPKIELLFENGGKFENISISKPNFELFKNDELKRIKYEKRQIDKDSIHRRFLSPFITDHKIDIYNNRLSAYYLEYERYLDRCKDAYQFSNLSFQLKIKVVNTGSFPANDIEVKFVIPIGIKASTEIVPTPSDVPIPPELETSPFPIADKLLYSAGHARQVINFPSKEYNVPKVNNSPSGDSVTIEIEKLKHNKEFNLKEFYLVFNTVDDIRNFNLEYQVFAGNIPELVKGSLNVKVNVI